LDILNQDIIGGKLIIPVLGDENFPPFHQLLNPGKDLTHSTM
jgi:hypothetical protein